MFGRRQDEELWRLQRELLAAEEEEEFDEDLDDGDFDDEDWDEEDLEDCFDSDYDEEYDQEQFRRNEEPENRGCASCYGRGSRKRFADDGIFDEEDFRETDVLYRKDYRKEKRRKRRRNFGLLLLAVLELAAIAAVILWWLSWAA